MEVKRLQNIRDILARSHIHDVFDLFSNWMKEQYGVQNDMFPRSFKTKYYGDLNASEFYNLYFRHNRAITIGMVLGKRIESSAKEMKEMLQTNRLEPSLFPFQTKQVTVNGKTVQMDSEQLSAIESCTEEFKYTGCNLGSKLYADSLNNELLDEIEDIFELGDIICESTLPVFDDTSMPKVYTVLNLINDCITVLSKNAVGDKAYQREQRKQILVNIITVLPLVFCPMYKYKLNSPLLSILMTSLGLCIIDELYKTDVAAYRAFVTELSREVLCKKSIDTSVLFSLHKMINVSDYSRVVSNFLSLFYDQISDKAMKEEEVIITLLETCKRFDSVMCFDGAVFKVANLTDTFLRKTMLHILYSSLLHLLGISLRSNFDMKNLLDVCYGGDTSVYALSSDILDPVDIERKNPNVGLLASINMGISIAQSIHIQLNKKKTFRANSDLQRDPQVVLAYKSIIVLFNELYSDIIRDSNSDLMIGKVVNILLNQLYVSYRIWMYDTFYMYCNLNTCPTEEYVNNIKNYYDIENCVFPTYGWQVYTSGYDTMVRPKAGVYYLSAGIAGFTTYYVDKSQANMEPIISLVYYLQKEMFLLCRDVLLLDAELVELESNTSLFYPSRLLSECETAMNDISPVCYELSFTTILFDLYDMIRYEILNNIRLEKMFDSEILDPTVFRKITPRFGKVFDINLFVNNFKLFLDTYSLVSIEAVSHMSSIIKQAAYVAANIEGGWLEEKYESMLGFNVLMPEGLLHLISMNTDRKYDIKELVTKYDAFGRILLRTYQRSKYAISSPLLSSIASKLFIYLEDGFVFNYGYPCVFLYGNPLTRLVLSNTLESDDDFCHVVIDYGNLISYVYREAIVDKNKDVLEDIDSVVDKICYKSAYFGEKIYKRMFEDGLAKNHVDVEALAINMLNQFDELCSVDIYGWGIFKSISLDWSRTEYKNFMLKNMCRNKTIKFLLSKPKKEQSVSVITSKSTNQQVDLTTPKDIPSLIVDKMNDVAALSDEAKEFRDDLIKFYMFKEHMSDEFLI